MPFAAHLEGMGMRAHERHQDTSPDSLPKSALTGIGIIPENTARCDNVGLMLAQLLTYQCPACAGYLQW